MAGRAAHRSRYVEQIDRAKDRLRRERFASLQQKSLRSDRNRVQRQHRFEGSFRLCWSGRGWLRPIYG
jgi:hypothetical protein